MVKIHSLGLLRVPNFFWNQLAQPRIDLDIGKFQFLVNVVEVLTVKENKDVALGKKSIFEVGTEAFIASFYWTRRSLLILKSLAPLNLLFSVDFILLFLTHPTFLSK